MRDDAPLDRGNRRIVVSEWDTAFVAGRGAEDTSLLMPFRPVAGHNGVYLADFYGDRVLRYDGTGRLLWAFGRKGAGPGEFLRIRDLKVDSAGRAWVFDAANQRITILTLQGKADRLIPLGPVGRATQGIVPLRDGGAVLITYDSRNPLVHIAPDGSVAEREPFPWPRFRELSFMASQLTSAADGATGHWVAAFQMGNGFFPFDGLTSLGPRRDFVENVEFPEIEQVRNGNGMETRMKSRPVTAAKAVSLSPTRIYVLFGGTGPYARRVVDTYTLENGSYVGSLLLPQVVDDVAWGDGSLYAVYTDPYPHLARWKPRGSNLP
jgi:hypothetical protein